MAGNFRRFRIGVAAAALLIGAYLAFDAEKPAEEMLTDVAGRSHRLPGRGECRALVLLFVTHECPMSNGYAPEIARLCQDFATRGVAFRVIYAERDLTPADAARHAKEFGFPCPAILDRELQLTARIGAITTPEAAILSPDGAVIYLGRIDDIYADFGQRRSQPRHRDLRDALDAMLNGRAVPKARTPPLGCRIDFGPHHAD